MRPKRAAPQIDGDRIAPTDRRDDVQIAAVERELEPVHLQPRAGRNPAGWLGRRLAQLFVQGGRTETVGVVLLRRD